MLAWSGSVVRSGFALDDREVLFENPVVTGALPLGAAFDRDYWHHRGDAGLWRPLPLLSLRLDRALWGADPRGYHATNVALHAAVVLLLGLLLVRLLRGAGGPAALAPWLGLALFAAHPALADSVAWICGRSSSLTALAGLAGALALARALDAPHPRPGLVAALAAAGLLAALACKEDGLAFAPLYLLLALRARARAPARSAAGACALGCAAAVGAWLAARAAALGAALPAAAHAPLAGASLAERARAGGGVVVEALRLAALPLDHAPRVGLADLPLADHPGPAAAVAALGWVLVATTVALAVRALRRRGAGGSLVAGSALVAAAALAPSLQLVPAPEVLAPRFLYLPLGLGAPLAGAACLHALAAVARPLRAPRAAPAGLALLVAGLLVGLCWQRAGVYASRASFWRARLAHAPADPAAWNDLGLGLEEEGDLAAARAAWERAIALEPRYSRAHSNLGRALLAAGELDAAARALERAAQEGPRNPIAQGNLGAVLLRLERPAEAAAAYRRATELAPGLAPAWRGLGRALLELGRRDAARAALERAAALDPADEGTARLRARLADEAR